MRINRLPIVSLFCGAGGLDWGFRRERFKVILACDNSTAAIKSYNLNTKERVGRLTDLSTVSVDDFATLMSETAGDVGPIGVIGGPPCQGFSRGNASADPNDVRNLLPFRYAEILSWLNSRSRLEFFVFENVMGLENPRHLNRFKAIKKDFEEAGFNIFAKELNASSFGVAQHRPRLFIVGLNSRIFSDVVFKFPPGRKHRRSVRDAIEGLPVPTFFKRGLTPTDIPYHPNHWTMMPKSRKFLEETLTDGRSFRRLAWDQASPTVAYGNREIHVHPDGGRRLSVHEAMLLQGFPPQYRLSGNFSQQITQVSNAVPPPMARALARAVLKVLLESRISDRAGSSRGEADQP